MTPGVNEPVRTHPPESVAGEPNVKNSYVDCATGVDAPRPRRPLPPPAGPALKGDSATSQDR
jgi:hypothetical protein